MKLGQDIVVLTNVEGTQEPVAASKSCTINLSQDFLDVCSPTDSRNYRKVPTIYEWSVSCDCLIATTHSAKKFIDAIKAGTELTLRFILEEQRLFGSAFVKSIELQGTKNNLAKYSVQFVGSGSLKEDTGWYFYENTMFIPNATFASGNLVPQGNFSNGNIAEAF